MISPAPVASPAVAFVTYLWHYLVARLVYDDLLRPFVNGREHMILPLVCVAGGAFVLGRATARRR